MAYQFAISTKCVNDKEIEPLKCDSESNYNQIIKALIYSEESFQSNYHSLLHCNAVKANFNTILICI